MNRLPYLPLLSLAFLLTISPGFAVEVVPGGKPNAEEEKYYRITTFKAPEGAVIEPGGLCLLRDGRLAVATRRGEVWIVDDPLAETVGPEQFHLFASGLHEALGIIEKQDGLYVVQRPELTRLQDTDNDGRADRYNNMNSGWGLTGDYHEYAFLSKPDAEGNVWIPLCLTGSFTSKAPYRGWCVRITPDGKLIPTCSGIRSPGGIGMNAAGDMFYTDNQGPWNGTCSLKHLAVGSFQGNPMSLEWYDLPAVKEAGMQKPAEPNSGSRIVDEAKRIPQFVPPAVQFPYAKMGQSASGIACDTSGGKFGPFADQLFVADQTHSTVMRVFLERVNGVYQGACFPFRAGFGSGNVPLELADSGHLFVGGTNRGWGSRGSEPFALERLDWTGKTPFEVQEMRALPDGFTLKFTQPVDPKSATQTDSYRLSTYTYNYQSTYGSPEVDHTSPRIRSIDVCDDHRTVTLKIEGLMPGHVHELHAGGVRSEDGDPLLHAEAYYTLNQIPESAAK